MITFEWDHDVRSSGAEVYLNGEFQCALYMCELPDLTEDNPFLWSLDIPFYDADAEKVKLRPYGMGRTSDPHLAIKEAEEAARRCCNRVLEIAA